MKSVKEIWGQCDGPEKPPVLQFAVELADTEFGSRLQGSGVSADGNFTAIIAEVDGMARLMASSRSADYQGWVVRAEVSGANGSFRGQCKLSGTCGDQFEEMWQIANTLELLGIMGSGSTLIVKVTFDEK